jgi:hypothetical protein
MKEIVFVAKKIYEKKEERDDLMNSFPEEQKSYFFRLFIQRDVEQENENGISSSQKKI